MYLCTLGVLLVGCLSFPLKINLNTKKKMKSKTLKRRACLFDQTFHPSSIPITTCANLRTWEP